MGTCLPVRLSVWLQGPLSAEQLRRLRQHHYSSLGQSVLDSTLQPWWEWILRFVPLHIAPNTLTLMGLFANAVSTLCLIAMCPGARETAPHWLYACCSLCLLVYQSLDALDGKQARRTGSASPLGELFDHGCDAVSAVFLAVGLCVAVRLGSHPTFTLLLCCIGNLLFYCAHWHAYVSGTLRFGRLDVTEVQFAIMGFHTISSAFGPEVWDVQLVPGVPWKLLPVLLVVVAFLYTLSHNLPAVWGRRFSEAGMGVFLPGIPIVIGITMTIAIASCSPGNVLRSQPCLFCLMFGLNIAKLATILVVCHMTMSPMCVLDSAFISPTLLFINILLGCPIPESTALPTAIVISTMDFFMYSFRLCRQISYSLQISVFTLPHLGHAH
uniref:diacylglycerol cholinephosphotransferase n=1 Tax=Eptatretus burgeri TaxID=7764 RepID=A0A8C4QI10_EPTBU